MTEGDLRAEVEFGQANTLLPPVCRLVATINARLPCRAEQDQWRVLGIDVHRHGPATGTSDHNIGPVLVILGLGDPDGSIEIVVGQGRLQNFVAVVLQVGRLQAAQCRLPTVKEQDLRGSIVADFGSAHMSHGNSLVNLATDGRRLHFGLPIECKPPDGGSKDNGDPYAGQGVR